jgi:hypothetical protein
MKDPDYTVETNRRAVFGFGEQEHVGVVIHFQEGHDAASLKALKKILARVTYLAEHDPSKIFPDMGGQ